MGGKILILEDQPLVLQTIEKALGKVGYDTTGVSGGRECVEALAVGPYDLFIADLHVPGVDTDVLCSKVRAFCPGIKFLFVSGAAAPPGMSPFLQKPFRIDDLRKTVKEILSGPQGI
ncbi:MAG: response regulator [Nitrospiraceae bacterium]|nr:response regulator [Nitrospiraceae bacterium]